MRVMVTGSRKWADEAAVYDALWTVHQEHGPFELVHGDCSTGADALAHLWWSIVGQKLGCTEQRWPAAWEAHGKAAGPMRNRRMVEAGADLVLAFPLPEGSGTQMTMELARAAGIKVREVKHG
ncbi:SLOG family protein [Streptomyces sp. t39]|uniref:SLOG family protein n=1 Tax=Streptomyces sp. t39 TaxID=1828156 RepID=UPI0011CE5FBC|nr:SLOG family protein [Streptomyces sp. t39]TXS35090.1 DUF2493 domain-containing protein [Streptomyces sp. t39]